MDVLVVSAAEAAKALKTRPDKILGLLETGEIPAVRDGSGWKIPKTLLIAYIENRAMAEAKARQRMNGGEKG